MKRILPLLALLVLPAAATDYYLCGSDPREHSSMTGTDSAKGWATSIGGTQVVKGATDSASVYHVPSSYQIRTPKSSSDYTFQGGRLVFDGTVPSVNLKLGATKKTLTIDHMTVASGTQVDFCGGADSYLYYLAGGDWTVEEGGILGLGSSVDGSRDLSCSARISGAGTIAVVGNGSYAGTSTLSGDLSGFTGAINVAWPKMSTAVGDYGFAKARTANHKLVISAASALPVATPDGDVLLGSVVVTNGATIAFACSATSPEIRGWTFGSGAMPTIDVASGCTVTIKGPVEGTVGFKKTGEGTLVLDVGGEGAYQPISLTGTNTVSAVTLSAYVARCEQWLAARNNGDLSASVSVGSVQMSSAVVTVSITALGADATSANVTVQVSEDSAFASPVATETFAISGDTPIVRSVEIENLEPSTTYYARAIVANNADASCTTAVATFTTARSGSSEKIVPGLEMYGALTLVDEIDCANDTEHRFRQYPADWSTVETILDVPTRVMRHKDDTCCYVSWRVGEGKGIVPNDPYVLVVDYPDDAPRSVTLFNFGNATRHGYHTGWTVGDSMSPPYVTQSLESWPVPYSMETKQLVQVMVPFEKSKQYNGSDDRIPMDTDGFDVNFGLIKAAEAKDSVGLAVSAIRLYKIDSYAAARPEIPYPADGLPRRIVTSREEMGDDDNFAGFAHPQDFYKGRAKMIRLLGMNTCSKDLLEFGYMQHWNAGDAYDRWSSSRDFWPKIVEHLGAEDIYVLPFYEYHGSRGPSGLGHDENSKPWTLEGDKYPDRKYLFSHQFYVYDCLADLTKSDRGAAGGDWDTLDDLKELFDLTVVPYMDKANFLGMWLRNRGAMPLGFGPNAIARFNRERSKNVSQSDIYNNGKYRGTALYEEYREWWYEKRRELFSDLHDYMENALDGARLYYSNTAEEPGEFWKNWSNPRPAILSNEAGYTYQNKNFNQFTGLNWSTDFEAAATGYGPKALFDDGTTWGVYEGDHACPADDPDNYRNLTGIALCYPFNCVWTVAGGYASQYRTAGGDLPFVRHYSLNENDFRNANDSEICGYYTCDWDHAGRAVMLAELYAMAYADPTMLGYLFTANLVRNDSTYVREFNLEYLSLPALPSEVLLGGSWPSKLTVRRWTTSAGTYWAVINCDSEPWSGTVDFGTSAQTVWRTVDGTPLALSGGKAALALEPFQMRCFTGVAPEPVLAPVFRYAYAAGIAEKSATLVAELGGLGEGSDWADVRWSLSAEDVAAAPFGSFARFTGRGEKTARVSGLVPGTTYTVVMTATGSNGETSTRTFDFTTAPWPFALSVPTTATDGNGTTATIAVRPTRVDRPSTLSLAVDGETVQTWNAVSAGTAYSKTIQLPMASIARYVFTIAEAGTGDYPLTTGGNVLGRKTIKWIDARFDDPSYDSFSFSGADPSGNMVGQWSSEESASVLSEKDGNRRVELETGDAGFVRYAPRDVSPDGWKARIEGRAKLVAVAGTPEAPASAPLASLALGRTNDVTRLYGYTAGGWVPFDGFRVPEDGWIDWSADFDFGERTVAYTANDVRLSAGGVSALPIAGNQTQVSRVAYVGMGEVDDFRGYYYEEEKLAEFDARIGTNRLTSLVFKAEGEPNAGDFAIEVEDTVEGLWYAAFGSDSLSVPVTNWTCVACAQAKGGTVELDADPLDDDGRPLVSQFFVVCGATEKITEGVRLGDVMPRH